MRPLIKGILALLLITGTGFAQTITTVAGNGNEGFSGDGGPAISAELGDPVGIAVDSLGNIYIAERSNCRVRKIDSSTGIITTIAGDGVRGYAGDGGPATNARLYNPEDK